ncbi:MAG TPA: lysylphosphatidylglycerol synthase transmembrane domain-containing protein [Terriglobales bacterium]|nr:lysylphosphatidylglycerol synthase transmembrane domain-containing protein [Terriglobales bacterium]
MNKKNYVAFAVVFVVLAVLVYLQFRTWRNFDWARLFQYGLNWPHILHGVGYIYLAYFLRAVRWKIFLRPVRKHASIMGLIPPTLIGFTGLALLGRPGELIRPYLIARRENLPFASQIAVWAVERIFDVGGFTVLMVAGIFLPSKLRTFTAAAPPEVRHWIHLTGYALIALVLGLLLAAVLTSYRGNRIAQWVEGRFSHLAENLGHRIAQKIREFTVGLNTIHGPFAFLQLSAVSVLMWWVIALAYKEVTHAYGAPMSGMSATKVLLLMGASMIGSMVQLPGVGGGSQLATISALDHIFDIVPKELAVSCGIMLWLVTFVAVVPVGLFLSHRERLSLRKLSAETAQAEAVAPAESTS